MPNLHLGFIPCGKAWHPSLMLQHFIGVLHGFSAILIASQFWLSDFFVV
jgi:hypothetical protein